MLGIALTVAVAVAQEEGRRGVQRGKLFYSLSSPLLFLSPRLHRGAACTSHPFLFICREG